MIFRYFVQFASVADRICATSRFDYQCNQLQRGSSPVSCQLVQDSIECAHRLRNGTADFGVFSAETALLLATLKHDGLSVIKELRHSDRLTRNLATYSTNTIQIIWLSTVYLIRLIFIQIKLISSPWL